MAKRESLRESRAPPRHATNEAEVECLGEKTREERDAEGRQQWSWSTSEERAQLAEPS
jgi:hypothetical protein